MATSTGIDAIYPLSPLQEGMLFHGVYEERSDPYLVQLSYSVHGDLDLIAWKRAWDTVIARHATFRTAFTWRRHQQPLQVVRGVAELTWQEQDWRGLSAAEGDTRLAAFLESDREQGLDLSKAPVMRCALFRIRHNEYQWVWTLHHMLADGRTVALVLDELNAYYTAYHRGEDLHLDPPRPFADYIDWLQRQDMAAAEGFWRRTLDGISGPTRMAGEGHRRPEPAGASDTPGEADLRLTPDGLKHLRALSRRGRVTINTIIQGTWAALLARYSGEDDVLFGATVFGRPPALAGSDGMVGLFINTLPVRATMPLGGSVLQWLQRFQQAQVDARQFDYAPLVDIQRWSRVPPGVPLFESVLVFESYPTEAVVGQPGSSNIEIRRSSVYERTNYPLTLAVSLTQDELVIKALYDRQQFDDATITRVLAHYRTLLDDIVANPNAEMSALSPWPAAEREQVVHLWNATAAPYPHDDTIPALVSRQASARPEAVALVSDSERITYAELEQRANRLAHWLQGQGIGPDVPVGVCLDRSTDLVVALLAVLKAGGAYVPLDPVYPSQRLAYMVADSGVQVTITHTNLSDALSSVSSKILCVDRVQDILQRQPTTPPRDAAGPEHLAYITYTSGSTGTPKGVAICHRSVVRLLCGTDYVRLGPEETLLQLAPITFDASTFEVWGALVHGGRLVLYPNRELDLPDLASVVTREHVTILWLTSSLYNTVIDQMPEALRGIRQLLIGGEALSVVHVRRGMAALPETTIINGYGPTEGTTFTCCYAIPREAVEDGATSISIGRPIANTTVYVVDGAGEPVPVGVVGELYIGGAGVARGYWGRAGLTASQFVPDAWGGAPGARVYRTGDRVRWGADGQLAFLGRRDQQVKLRGFRIEPGEIAAVLSGYPGVTGAVVVVEPEAAGGARLVAYVARPAGTAVDEAAVQAYLAARLPAYMVPAVVVGLDALPLTPNGKLDRAALPRPAGPSAAGAALPRTPAEAALAAIWAEVLGVPQVGVDANFFALGGHSLLAMRVMAQVRTRLGATLPLRALFEAPTVAALAARLAMATSAAAGAAEPPLRPRAPGGAVPLSFAQERLWFVQQVAPTSAAYHVPLALRLSGPLDAAALARSLSEIVRRHEVLRTVFDVAATGPVPVVRAAAPVALPVEPGPADAAGLAAVLAAEAARPFDLRTGPLLRVRLLQEAADVHVLLVVWHHVVTDGWSLGVFARELAALYAAYATGRASPLAPLPVQYADYAVWQRARWDAARLATALQYWQTRLAGAPALLALPTDRPRPAVARGRGAAQPVVLPAALLPGLTALSQAAGTTWFMTLLAAWLILLHRYTGQPDLVVGTSSAGRTPAETEPLLGLFFNLLALRTDLGGAPTVREVLARVRETTLDAYAHQELPFERLVAAGGAARSLSYAPVFQVLFEVQHTPPGGLGLPGLTATWLPVPTATAKYDLTLSLEEDGTAISGRLEYDTDLFDAATIARLVTHYETLLAAMVATPEARISALPLLPAAERQQVVATWNATAEPWPAVCLHTLFEAQVARTPAAWAVRDAAEAVTYATLEARANQLAHLLQQHGVGPDVRVGVCVERRVALVVALLGILKAGGAYVPLDPTFPPERLTFMLADAGAAVLVTQTTGPAGLGAAVPVVVALDTAAAALAAQPASPPVTPVTPAHLAYLYYTSGSTGRPKGVAVAHAGIANYVRWGCRAYHAGAGHGAPVHSSIAVDLTLTNVLPLFVGGCLTLVPEGPGVDGLAAVLQATPGFGLLKLTPTHLALLNQQVAPAVLAASTRVLVIGADHLVADPTLVWRDHAPQVCLINEYGPTETVVGCCTYTLPADGPRTGAVPIGRPIANITMYVLDGHGAPMPIGVPGELAIGGIGVARGYWGRAALTAAAFGPDPFGAPGARLYHTGDRARWRGDGQLEFLGRRDDQLKIRGFRIEPGEIEAALRTAPGVDTAVVLPRLDGPTGPRLVAYVALPTRTADSLARLRAHLKTQLPDYMIPATFVLLDALPLAANGKLDRAALPAPDLDQSPLAPTYVPPADPLELQLVQTWEEVFAMHPVGTTDDFFELGGHSLLAVTLLTRVKERFDCAVPLTTLVRGGTIKDVAAVIRETRSTTDSSVLVPIQPAGTRMPLFCIHPAGGGVLCYVNLARHLGFDQPVYGLQDPLFSRGGFSSVPVPVLAARYIDEIRRMQPSGPYHLAGWSFGGIVAFDMAQQLVKQGHTVGLLGILDTASSVFTRGFTRTDVNERKILAALAREHAFTNGITLSLTNEELNGLTREDQLAFVLARLKEVGAVRADMASTAIDLMLQRWWTRIECLQAYAPRPYSGRITLFRSSEVDVELQRDLPELTVQRHAEPSLGWNQLSAAPIEIHDVPGQHATIGSEPHVRVLAATLETCLAGANGESAAAVAAGSLRAAF